ncbi:MAG: hypothetical protein EOS06_18005 [Mesorhizobium sp.]|nr:MAG: hypothetical protein EOS06_18005 [Mesorhizobium sp.]
MTQTLVYIGKITTPHSVQHPSTVSALRADPPSPTRGEGESLRSRWTHPQRLRRRQPAMSRYGVAGIGRQPHE